MPILTSGDYLAMQQDVTLLINENPTTLILRRGSSNLSPQTVRVELKSTISGAVSEFGPVRQVRATVVILGTTTLDIQPQDRFTHQGQMYRVNVVDPNRQIGTQAEAYLDQ